MNQVGRILLKAIFQNNWVKIEYKNLDNETTKFMIGINKIYSDSKKLIIDSFNITYKDTVEDRSVFFDQIISAELCEGTLHKTPDELINEISNYPEKYSFLQGDFKNEDLIEYYLECYTLDSVPYESDYALISGIDDDEIAKNEEYPLSDLQFKEFATKIFTKKDKQKKRSAEGKSIINHTLAMNILSIKTKRGLYVLCYKEFELDIKRRRLVANNNIIVNKEFAFDSDTMNAKNKECYTKYLPEEDYILFDNVKDNLPKIIESIQSYNHTRTASYKNEIKYDTKPYIINLSRKPSIDMATQLEGLTKMINSKEDVSLPILTFLGENVKLSKRTSYPIFVVDKKYNIDQINAIDKGMKSPVSYIQGPPGTGKTKTLLNAIVTAEFNGKTVLVTSNNNIPMDGVYEEILKLKYKDSYPLLFPAIRLGNVDNLDKAIDRINEMRKLSKNLNVNEELIDRIKKNRKESMRDLVNLLEKYDDLLQLQKKKDVFKKIQSNFPPELDISLLGYQSGIDKEIDSIGDIDLNDFEKYMSLDFYNLFMAIHFETAGRIKKIEKPKFSDLRTILDMTCTSEEERKDRRVAFKRYLNNSESLRKFQEIFPIIISTNLSCSYLGDPTIQFDMVMMDEAGQCSITNALVPILRSKQLILVGDPQQLRPVIVLDTKINDKLKAKYHIPDEYDYIKNSIYTTFTQIDIINNETLLSYHYRCNDKIINFSNKKYYNSKLKLNGASEEQYPLYFYDTTDADGKDNTTEKNISRVEAEFIVKYLKENPNDDVGIITPFVRQKECIESFLSDAHINNVSVGTVHAFQGDQKRVVIFSTAVTSRTQKGTYAWLKDNKELINVAVSRPVNKLIMLGSYDAINGLSDGSDDLFELTKYVKTNGISKVTNVSIASQALGTKQISTDSEKEFGETVKHALSTISQNCYIRTENQLSRIFEKEGTENLDFYMQSIDLIVFEKRYGGDVMLAGFELNGPEHYNDESVKTRDRIKKEFCEKHNLKLYSVPRDCARDYQLVKNILKELM